MEKFIVHFDNGTSMHVWSTDKKMAKFHLEPYAVKNKLKITKVVKAAA